MACTIIAFFWFDRCSAKPQQTTQETDTEGETDPTEGETDPTEGETDTKGETGATLMIKQVSDLSASVHIRIHQTPTDKL